ncbi:MAG: ABC transporter permease [Gemmatimonadaceae bacterium]
MAALLPLRYAWRSLRRAPAFTIAASLTLALGVGATTAIFSVVNAVLLRPLPYSESGRLVGIWHSLPGINLPQIGHSLGTYFTYRKLTTSFDEIGAYDSYSVSVSDVAGGGAAPERLVASEITPSLLPVLKVSPLLGRNFSDAEGQPNGAAVTIISDELWRRRFGADPALVGRTIQLDGRAREVIGVMPAGFHFPDTKVQLWLPLVLDPAETLAGGFDFNGVARLRPGVSIGAAESDVQRAMVRLPELYPNLAPGLGMAGIIENAKMRVALHPLRDDIIGAFGQVLWIVAATAGLVLLVACANVANLLLVRAEGRQKELTVRAALGAGRRRVLGHFLAEGVVLSIIGGALGVLLAAIGVGLLVRYGPAELPRLNEVSVDGTALIFALIVTVAATLLATFVPAIRQSQLNLGSMLREGGRSGTAGRARQQTRGVLVSAQVALALVLLSGSGVLARSVMRLQAVRPGFDATNILTLRLDLPSATYRQPADMARFYEQLIARLSALPGVRMVGVTSKLPLQLEGSNLNPVWREDRPQAPNDLPPLAVFVRANGSYFQTMGISLIAGRTFTSMTDAQSPFEVIVSRKLAREQWGDSSGTGVLGRRVKLLNGTSYTVVGVVETVRDSSLASDPTAQIYFPVVPAADTGRDNRITSLGTLSVVIRTASDPGALSSVVRREVFALDPTLPIFNLRAMEEVVARSLARISFTLLVLAVAAIVALVLGAIGLYGVIAYVVSLRTREIGVRIALGARPGEVGRLVARQGMLLALAGVAVGLVAFALLARALRAFLFEVTPTDPVTLIGVSVLLVVVAAGASWIPARRAARIDPVEAMRAE